MALPDGTVIPPTGKAFDVEFGQTSKWDGDQLIIISAFWDAALQRHQLGLLPVVGGDEGQAGDALVGPIAAPSRTCGGVSWTRNRPPQAGRLGQEP
jgi:hypothetical protein